MAYQIIGDIVLGKGLTKETAEKILNKMPRIKTVCAIERVDGEFRQPVIRKIAGNGYETIHRENGILYSLDVSKIMFSKGNVEERKRLLPFICRDETVIDMFAGIGYFSLGIAKKAGRVIAIEKNTEAFYYLGRNIALNKLVNVDAVNSDCRSVKAEGNRVIMGYFPGTEAFLECAEKMLPHGGMIHYHNLAVSADDITSQLESGLARNFDILLIRKVKSYSPRLNHFVADVKICES